MTTENHSNQDIEKNILDLLSNNLLSVTQISRKLGVRKDVGSAILESMRKKGKLQLFVVGKSKVYTLPRIISRYRSELKKYPEKRIKTIGIVSGKGGVGKTTITLNLAGALMTLNQSVIAIDTDIKMAGLGLQLGMYNLSKTLNNAIKNNRNILEALHIHSSGLRIIPASLNMEILDLSDLYGKIEKSLSPESIVLIDSPPGLEDNSIQVLNSCKEIIVVVTPEYQSLTNSIKVIDKARDLGVKPLGVVVNRYLNKKSHKKMIKEIEFICELPILGIIPEDRSIQDSIFKKTPNIFLNPYSHSSIIFKKIAAKISGIKYNPPRLAFLMNIWGKLT